jgi:CheY-like chemotaxis protein
MTADAMPEDVARCRAAGMDDYLAKPVGLASLVPVLERRLAAEPAQPAALTC